MQDNIRHTNDVEAANKSSSPLPKDVLRIIDAPFDGKPPQECAIFSLGVDIAEGIKNLPTHKRGTARILDVTIHSDFKIYGLRDAKGPEATRSVRDELTTFLKATYTEQFQERQIFRWLSDPLLVNDVGSISSQWSQRLDSDKSNFYRLVNRTSLQQDPLDYDLHPRDSYLTCAQDTNDRLIIIIVNDVWSKQDFCANKSHVTTFENPRIISSMLAETAWTSYSDGSLDTFAKLLTLDFFLASIYLQPVDYYGKLIYPELSKDGVLEFSLTKNPHLQVPLGLFEPRLSAKSSEAFKEIEDAEGILRSVNNLVDSIEFVIKALTPNSTGVTQQPALKGHERRMQELEALCDERRDNAKRALEALNRQLDYLTKRHAIRESKAIKILTILASLYLPLSLSASLLGMQTPFRAVAHTVTAADQTLVGSNLLFDFFGVFIWLATATMFIVCGIKFAIWLKSNGLGILSRNFRGQFSIWTYGKRWRFGGLGGKIFEYLYSFITWWIGAGFCIMLLIVFWIGMLGNAQVAWDTAEWGFPAWFIVSLALGGCYYGLYCFLSSRRVRKQ